MAIKLSISGIRGKFHELSPYRVVEFAQAYSNYIGGGDVFIGSDSRPSGKFIREALIAGLTAAGSNVVDYGNLPTPILQWLIKNASCSGGISITAGHNTFDWNCLIFLNAEGSYINHIEGEEFFNVYHSGRFTTQKYDRIGTYSQQESPPERYFNALAINEKSDKFPKFVVDCSNGFTEDIIEKLSLALHVKMIPIFSSKTNIMEKDPEPTIPNAQLLGTIVRETGSDGGFLLNSDASRVLVVDEYGQPHSEELTLPIFASIILEKEKSHIVTNYSTSITIDQVAKKFNSRVFRTDVGQPQVVQSVQDLKTTIGGEGSGSIIYSPFSSGFDSFYFIRTIIQYLHQNKVSLSYIASQFVPPRIYKETLFLPQTKIYKILERIGNLYTPTVRLKDGFYIRNGEDWLCIRASATVSMIRIVGEGESITDEIARIKELVI